MKTARVWGAAALVCALVATPGVALAQVPDPGTAREVTTATGAVTSAPLATAVRVAPPLVGSRTLYLLGQAAPISATVTWAPSTDTEVLTGEMEFWDGATALGTVPVTGSGGTATATIETDAWPAAGLRRITGRFTPRDPEAFTAAESPARDYRIVDTSRMVPDIALTGESVATIGSASLEWTVANIWFSNFEVGFEREVRSGSVTLPEATPGDTIAQKQAYYFRPFTFSEGSGMRDAAGNRIISYTGEVRLTSGSANHWDFRDPQVHIGPSGDGYVTAVVSGSYALGTEAFPIDPVRVTVATFSGADIAPTREGIVDTTIELNWVGQAGAPGTWAHDYADSFPTEFVSLLHPAITLFFARSSVATDDSKIPHPIRLRFTETPEAVKPPVGKVPFTDVRPGDKFSQEIAWMWQAKLSTGTKQADGTVTYLPKQNVSREAMAAFLYRLEGAKVQGPKVSPFADVQPGDKFATEIAWMHANRLSTGTKQPSGKPKYLPKSQITREAMAAFMYRLEGASFTPPKVSPFADVQPGDRFYREITWMHASGLSTGTRQASGKPKYLPKGATSREAMAAFLYRSQHRESR
ncbi:Ig-like domain-containing protein [Leucobacter chromiireducens]|uniref:Ig-like domain repeat protein n=1 Tax=Leucobacter chromiireducens subsp. solipictus TaxID=398235 RepID=A0ABS1SH39_9MICO|nr:Ig-like domain repeat protein [Leucobacter chromiireducens subsp. solipictus]